MGKGSASCVFLLPGHRMGRLCRQRAASGRRPYGHGARALRRCRGHARFGRGHRATTAAWRTSRACAPGRPPRTPSSIPPSVTISRASPKMPRPERKAIDALGDALAETGKPLIVTSGVALIAPGRLVTEDDVRDPERCRFPVTPRRRQPLWPRARVRVSIIRLAPSVHGKGDHGFRPDRRRYGPRARRLRVHW